MRGAEPRRRGRAPAAAIAAAAVIAVIAAIAPAPAWAQQPQLQARARAIADGVSGDWGIFAWSIDRRQALIAIDHHAPMIPASNNKVFTSIWALDLLGPDHRFTTELLLTGEVRAGVLEGDVILRGSGDPTFGYPELETDPMAPLRTMAQRLRSLGITAVRGSIVADPFVFDTVGVGPAWPNDTGGGSAYYAPRVSGLAFQRNVVFVEVRRGSNGGAPDVQLDPPVSDVVPVVSTVRPGGGRAWAVREPDGDTIRVRGNISGQGPLRFPIGVSRPAALAAGALRAALLEAGIRVQGGVAIGAAPEGAHVVHRRVSIPVAEILPMLNRESDNFFAEHLWKAAAAKAAGVGSYRTGGAASALHFIRRADVPPGELYQFDGSGLSRYDRASAYAMVHALVYAHSRPYSRIFHSSLAVAGDPDGTLNRLFRGSPADGNLHAKTGYIQGVRTLSGYVRAANGELIAFSFLYNGRNTFGSRSAQTELGNLLASYGGGASPVDTTEGADGDR